MITDIVGEIKNLLLKMEELDASDLHLKDGRPPLMRVDGILKPLDMDPLTKENAEGLLGLLNDFQLNRFNQNNSVDLSYEQSEKSRFRVNIFKQRGSYGAVFRKIPIKIPTMQELLIPEVIKTILPKPQGLFLVTGPTGSGKSTTLAAMINEINQSQELHVITVEDPIEFIFTDKVASITQREIGIDCDISCTISWRWIACLARSRNNSREAPDDTGCRTDCVEFIDTPVVSGIVINCTEVKCCPCLVALVAAGTGFAEVHIM